MTNATVALSQMESMPKLTMDKAIMGRQKIIETPVRYRMNVGLNLKSVADIMWRVGGDQRGGD